ncbi:hypothetical protein Forpi1262_v016792 [Fusarium oxysporum f. sp. raphani]|uniref:Rhodopsin domain-containing protein n=1 Tax=Fusarium oxysporum f. sp. raphani TaxID=96318 RepID=A0A8J5TTQ1_FUSOX|nr:hypothetical protein Forpi1262_v016792 [Fusarium oxysporum f. sp. raphani]
MLHSFGWDDGFMILAQIFALGTGVAEGLENKYGLGYHTWEQPKGSKVPYLQAFYASIVSFTVAMCIVKIAILFQYRRVFTVPVMQTITFYGLIFMFCWTVTSTFLTTLVCVPVAKFWDSTIPGRCLPMLTTCTCAISIYRIHTLKHAALVKDPMWDNVDAATWSFIEINMAIVAACLPTLRKMFSKLMPRLFASSYGRSNNPSSYGQFDVSPNSQRLRTLPRTKTEERVKRSTNDETPLCDSDSILKLPASYRSFSRLQPTMSVNITGGQQRENNREETGHLSPESETGQSVGGIKATTVIVQKVLSKETRGEKWEMNRKIYQSDEHSDERMVRAIDMGWFILSKYYRLTDEVPVYAAALLLDPRKCIAYIKQS